jgi:glutamate formiminotransferase/glutamate formiminotransferase/formiminotetrahydrofolate cyclodeaminase
MRPRIEQQILLAVPNISEGRDGRAVDAIGDAFAGAGAGGEAVSAGRTGSGDAQGGSPAGVRVLDVHSDPDHHRSVFTLAGPPGELSDALLGGAARASEWIDVMGDLGGARSTGGARSRAGARGRSLGADEPIAQHPFVGAVDVIPIVYLHPRDRGMACAVALVVADRIGEELGIPVFLYGELAERPRRTRAELRRGGVAGLAARMALGGDSPGGDRPDFGPPRMHPTAGAALVAARGPLVAFNLELEPGASIEDARAIAALVREGGKEGLPGVRAIGVELRGGVAQVSMNVERPLETPLARIVRAVAGHAGVARAELVGLAPRAALEGFPADVPLPGFDPARHLIENALGSLYGPDQA